MPDLRLLVVVIEEEAKRVRAATNHVVHVAARLRGVPTAGKKKAVGSILMSSGVAPHQAPKNYWEITSPSENAAK
jgi:hypothetical protein